MPKTPKTIEPVLLPNSLRTMISEYLDADIKIPPNNFTQQLGNPTLFGLTVPQLLKQLAKRAANLLLHGGKKEVEEMLQILEYNPQITMMQTVGIDPNGNTVPGTLPEIAAKAGEITVANTDVMSAINSNVQAVIHNIKQRGLFDQIILLRQQRLSLGEIEKLKTVIQLEGDARTQKIKDALIAFATAIVQSDDDLHYQNALDTYLETFSPSTIHSHFVLDLKILSDAATWFNDNKNSFNEEQTLQFWKDGFNTLLNHLSSRDKQLLHAGIFSDHEIVEYQFKPMPLECEEMKMPELSNGLIYLSYNGDYYLQNVDGEIHQGNVQSRRLQNIPELLLECIGHAHSKSEILKLIADNGHVQLTPKTTPARSVNQDSLSPESNLLLLFRPAERSEIEKNPHLLANYLKDECHVIAFNFGEHRSKKYCNFIRSLIQFKQEAEKQKICRIS